jgi:hypothetical protein
MPDADAARDLAAENAGTQALGEVHRRIISHLDSRVPSRLDAAVTWRVRSEQWTS